MQRPEQVPLGQATFAAQAAQCRAQLGGGGLALPADVVRGHHARPQ